MKTELSGTITPFKGNGRLLGYPTANLRIATDLVDGVYFGFADLVKYKKHPVIIFIGTPTTLGDKERRIEAHLLDIPDKNYYGLDLSLVVRHYHRPNQTFADVNSLLNVMRDDEARAREWFQLRKS